MLTKLVVIIKCRLQDALHWMNCETPHSSTVLCPHKAHLHIMLTLRCSCHVQTLEAITMPVGRLTDLFLLLQVSGGLKLNESIMIDTLHPDGYGFTMMLYECFEAALQKRIDKSMFPSVLWTD